ncbi:MAG: nuclear transport factor 2 family protein [Proteobacteria bacterium]|nr:nuclear transport factor 2 family protein [Pseudomonadota bacterium]
MTELNTPAAEATVAAYLESWNETDPARRQAAIARAWAAAGTYRDPLMVSDGHAGIDAMLAAVQARFPGFVLKRISAVEAHNGSARFAWSLGPAAGPSVVEGVDFCAFDQGGRLERVVGFIDKM